jgi:DNA-binding CsgD family transcriptional regulator
MSEYSDAPTTPMLEEFLLPQGLAPESPIVHITTPEQAMLSSGIAVYRRENSPEITNAQLATADRLVPHLARAIRIHGKLADSEHSQVALHEVIDRIPTGVLIVDERRRPVITNRMADRIAASRDGFAIDDEGPKGLNRESTNKLRKLIDSAVRPAPGREMSGGGFMALERFSGRRPYPVLITPILGRSEHSSMADVAAIIFISDPEIRDVSIVNVLMEMYGLTPAEAELAQFLSQGNSLEETAKARHVTLNTVRGQLKQIFAKTNTNRQGELLQLVLSGVASVDSLPGIGDSASHPGRREAPRARRFQPEPPSGDEPRTMRLADRRGSAVVWGSRNAADMERPLSIPRSHVEEAGPERDFIGTATTRRRGCRGRPQTARRCRARARASVRAGRRG